MADTIKLGNITIDAFKVGGDDCAIYLGSTLLYSGGTTPPTPPAFDGKWLATYSDSSTQSAACDASNTIITNGDITLENLTDVEVGSCVTELSANGSYYGAFDSAASLTSVTLNEGLQIIGIHAFQRCTSLTSITIPSGVTSIGGAAFFQCESLTSVTIPNSVTSIGSNAFQGCSGLASITIPSSVTSIGTSTFNSCSGLTSITIPSGVTSIGSSAFYYCSGLASITIPSSVTSIGSSAFNSCSGLRSVIIGSGIESIGKNAFRDCSGLTSITIEATTPPTLQRGNEFNYTNDCPIYVPSGSVETYKTANNWTTYASRIQAIST